MMTRELFKASELIELAKIIRAAKEKVSLPDASLFIIEGEIYFDKNEVFEKLIKRRILPIPKKTLTKTQVDVILGLSAKFEPQYSCNGVDFYDSVALEKHLINELGEAEDQARDRIEEVLNRDANTLVWESRKNP